MSTTFRRYAPEQSLLLPPDVREWLPEGHLSHHISDLVDGLDLTAFYAGFEGDGRRNAPYEPRMLVRCCSTPTRRVCFRRVGLRGSWNPLRQIRRNQPRTAGPAAPHPRRSSCPAIRE